MLRHVLAGGAWSLLLRLAFLGLTLATMALLARATHADVMGSYFVCLSVAAFAGLVMNRGISGLALREVGAAISNGDVELAARHTGAALKSSIRSALALLLASAAATAVGDLIPGLPSAGAIFLVGVLAATTNFQAVLGDVFRGHGRIVEASLFGSTLSAVVGLGLLLIVLACGRGDSLTLTQALGLAAAAQATAVLIGAARLPGLWTGASSDWNARRAGPFWWTSLAFFVMSQADLWVAAAVLPLDLVAIYGAAARLRQPLALPIEAVEAAAAPSVLALHSSRSVGQLQYVLTRLARIQLLLCGIGTAILVAGRHELLAGIFGTSYRRGATALVLISLAWCVRAAAGPFSSVLLLTGHERAIARLAIVCAGASVPLQWCCAALWGLEGLAAASAAALILFCFAGAALAKRLTGATTACWHPL